VAGDVRTMSFTAPGTYRKGGRGEVEAEEYKIPTPFFRLLLFPFSLVPRLPFTPISLSYSGYQRMEGVPKMARLDLDVFLSEDKSLLETTDFCAISC
jgi:hypothetical protein